MKGTHDQTNTCQCHPSYNLLTTEIEVFDSLAELALEMHWSWEHSTGEVWRRAESQTVGNPIPPGLSCRRS